MKSFIVGDRVSEFARSPKIWNSLYKEFQLDGSMTPLDANVETIRDVLLEVARIEGKFCGLIAAPLKDHDIWFSPIRKSMADRARSANYFEFENNSIKYIDNFDGKAAIATISSQIHNARTKIRHVLLIGTGPVARIIGSELKSFLSLDSEVLFFTRDSKHNKASLIIKEFGKIHTIARLEDLLPLADLVINCTPIGSPRYPGSPLSDSQLLCMGTESAYFDVNYGQELPHGVKRTLEMGKNGFDGLEMNKLQAAMAFLFANNLSCDLGEVVRNIENS